ncbi:MAG: ATP-binding protein [Pseudomonadota bacterium]
MGFKSAIIVVIALVAAFVWIAGASVIARTLSDIADTPWVVGLYLASLTALIIALYAIYRRRFAKPSRRKKPPIERTKRPAEQVLDDIDRRLTDPSEMERVGRDEAAPSTVALCGAPGVGTSTVAGLLAGRFDPDLISDIGAISTDAEENRRVLALARRARIPVLVVDNDLRAHEHEAATTLAAHNPQVIIALNKADTFQAGDLNRLKDIIAERLEGVIDPGRIVTIASDPRPIRRVQASGAEEEINQEPDISALADLISSNLSPERAKDR